MSASQERHLDDPTYADRLHRTRATRRSGRPRSGGTGTFWAADMGGSGSRIDGRCAQEPAIQDGCGAAPERAICAGVRSSLAQVDIWMLIRVAESGDTEVVVALRDAALSASAPSVYSAREVVELLDGLDVDELRAMIEDRQLFVAETDGLIVGCAGWRGTYLRHVYIAPDLQREGVGTRLVARAESDFRDRTSSAV